MLQLAFGSRKDDSPGLEVGDGLLDDMADLVNLLVELFLPVQQVAISGFLHGVIMSLPTYLSPTQLSGSRFSSTPDSLRQCESWRLPSIGSEIHARVPLRVQATCTFMPVVLCLPEYTFG